MHNSDKSFFFKTINSTSKQAFIIAEKEKKSLPFYVWALEQTEGRGQRGKIWQSPAGNLYITLVTKVFPHIPIYKTALATACFMVKWLKKEFGLDATIKWPNDILIKGKKVCGILVESTSIHDERLLFTGIGLNLLNSPSGIDYLTGSIREELFLSKSSFKDKFSLEKIVESLSDFFFTFHSSYTEEEMNREFLSYAIPAGNLWFKDDSFVHLSYPEDLTGIIFQETRPPFQEVSYTTASHGFLWVYQTDFFPKLSLFKREESFWILFSSKEEENLFPGEKFPEILLEFSQILTPIFFPKHQGWPLFIDAASYDFFKDYPLGKDFNWLVSERI